MTQRKNLKVTNRFINDDLTIELSTKKEIMNFYKAYKEDGRKVALIGTRLKMDNDL